MTTFSDNRLVVFVDPSGGYRGVHNASVLDLLASRQAADFVGLKFAAAVNARIPAALRERLEAANVQVLPVFDLHGYQLSGRVPDQQEITPYVATLGAEFTALFERLSLLHLSEEIHLVYHTMSWEHVMAVVSALRTSSVACSFVHHVFLMYWPGIDQAGKTTDAALRMRYKVALSGLPADGSVRLYTSTSEYQIAYQSLLGDKMRCELHPFFLDEWSSHAVPAKRFEREGVRKILAYSGEIREAKGFEDLPGLIETLLDNFPDTEELVVHLAAKSAQIPRQFRGTYEAVLDKARKDTRIKVFHAFLSSLDMSKLIESADVVALNYQSDFYRYKTSGFVWQAARFGTACIVPAHTWLARETQRLDLQSFVFEGGRILPDSKEVNGWSPEKIERYRESILQPFGPWLEDVTQEASVKMPPLRKAI